MSDDFRIHSDRDLDQFSNAVEWLRNPRWKLQIMGNRNIRIVAKSNICSIGQFALKPSQTFNALQETNANAWANALFVVNSPFWKFTFDFHSECKHEFCPAPQTFSFAYCLNVTHRKFDKFSVSPSFSSEHIFWMCNRQAVTIDATKATKAHKQKKDEKIHSDETSTTTTIQNTRTKIRNGKNENKYGNVMEAK